MQYVPSEVTLMIGNVPISGFQKGSFIRITKPADTTSVVEGIGGEHTFVHNLSKVYNVEFTLMRDAPANTYLSGVQIADEVNPGSGTVPTAVKNLRGVEFFNSIQAKITKLPDTDFDDAAAPKVWRVIAIVEPGQYFPGGEV